MSNYGWTNADGEPMMDGAAYRFEQALDADYAEQRYLDDDEFFGDDEHDEDCEGTYADCPYGGCSACDDDSDRDDYAMDPFVMEDQWLDGSYEE